MEGTCWCGLKYFKLEEIFSNRVSKRSCPWKPFSVLKTFQECERQNLNVSLEGKASAEVKVYPYISVGNFHFSTFYFLRYAQVQNQKDGMENSGKLLKNTIDEECEIFRELFLYEHKYITKFSELY